MILSAGASTLGPIGTCSNRYRIKSEWRGWNGWASRGPKRLPGIWSPPPHIDSDDHAVVPAFTEWLLTRFETDDRVFHEFAAGWDRFKVYSGDIAAEHEAEAAVARRFLNHPARRIREMGGCRRAISPGGGQKGPSMGGRAGPAMIPMAQWRIPQPEDAALLTPERMADLADRMDEAVASLRAWGIRVIDAGRLRPERCAPPSCVTAGSFPTAESELAAVAHAARNAQEFAEIAAVLPDDELQPLAVDLQHSVGGL